MGPRILAAVFTVLILIVAILYVPFVFGPHSDGSGVPYLIGYLVLAPTLLWLACFLLERFKIPALQYTLLSVLGLASVGAGLFPFAQDFYLSASEKKVAAGITVDNVKDQVLLTDRGNPVGIRVKYAIRASESGRYNPLVFLFPQGGGPGDHPLNMRRRSGGFFDSVEPPLDPRDTLRPGVTYTVTVDMIPKFLVENNARTRFCIHSNDPHWAVYGNEFEEFLRNPGVTTEYQVRIIISTSDQFGVGHGDFHTVFDGLTQNSYNPRVFYEDALKESAQECVPGSGMNF